MAQAKGSSYKKIMGLIHKIKLPLKSHILDYKKAYKISGWLTVVIAAIVYFFSVQRTGSLWDCGEFISGAYKLEVVHPPGAPLFLMVGHLFAMLGEWFSTDPADIAFMVNLLSGLSTAFGVGFLAWTTFLFGKLAMVGREGETSGAQNIALALGGVVAGLTAAFCISVYFSAVEGEVYAMSFFFTMLVLWSMVVWYSKPDTRESDRWIVFALYAAGLSIGVHLLSLLALPTAALLYYFKKYDKVTPLGVLVSLAAGGAVVIFIQKIVIVGIPTLWAWFDYFMVNTLGMGFNTGIIPTVIVVFAILAYGLMQAHKRNNHFLQMAFMSAMLICISFSTIGVVVIRATANPPINMNNPDDPYSLLPYLNREQYGERPILYGPSFEATPERTTVEPRYGRVGDKYEIVNYKLSYEYSSGDKMLFPRMGHLTDDAQYRSWIGKGTPNMWDNLSFFIQYQINWMYWRYFMWNFVGRENAHQGYTPTNKADGQWMSGISFIDQARLYDMDKEPEWRKNAEGRNTYYFIPLILGIIGLIYSYKKRKRDFFSLLVLFLITGIGIIIYSNQPPQEPRERDYVLAGSFATFAIWVGLAVPALFSLLKAKLKNVNKEIIAIACGVLVLLAPAIMLSENYDDMGRKDLYASRDYASNFLNSLEKNAIIFTYGDNDTYPLWYAQEVEGIRTDVRVINLSLIAVDWYINQMRRKVNKSPAVDMSISPEQYRGYRHNQLFLYDGTDKTPEQMVSFDQFVQMINTGKTEIKNPSREMSQFAIPIGRVAVKIDKSQVRQLYGYKDSLMQQVQKYIVFDNRNKSYLTKDDIAIMDIIASNINKRPIYFASTVRRSKMLGLDDYMQYEGLAMRVTPVRTPSDSRMAIFGSGRIDADKVLENAETLFKWGNLDKKEMFVDESFAPAVQSHRMVFMRAMEKFMQLGEMKKAVKMSDIYINGFPNMNFPFGFFTVPFISPYVEVGQYDRAYALIDQTLSNLKARIDFYRSIDPDIVQASFSRKQRLAYSGLSRLQNLVRQLPDSDKKKAYTEEIKKYLPQQAG